MKKTVVFLLVMVVYSISAFAVGAGIGVRSIAMGGTGIAIANDVVTSAYFNPAALMTGPENAEFQLAAGGSTQSISEITSIIGEMSDSENLITNLLPKEFDVNAGLSAGLGFSARKVGLSVLATGVTNFRKNADELDMNINALVNAAVPLTIGSTFNTPGLPIASMSVGVNLKSLYDVRMLTSLTSTAGTASGETSFSLGSGFGFDVGVLAKITPLISVGGVIRNLSASETLTTTTRTLVATLDAGGNPAVTEGDETVVKSTFTPPAEVGVGVGIIVPITGTLIAVDLDNYSYPDNLNYNQSISYTDTHIGIEQGILFNMLMLRAGYFTYGAAEDSYYTYGIGFNAGPASLGFAAANSVKDSNNSIAEAQLGIAF